MICETPFVAKALAAQLLIIAGEKISQTKT
jgi:hypothetical protein